MYLSENIEAFTRIVNDEVENFRAALEWGLENHPEENLRLAANFCVACSWEGYLVEGVEVVKTAVERAQALLPVEGDAALQRKRLIAKALFAQGMVGLGGGNMVEVLQALKEAIAISRVTGDKQILGYSLGMYYTATTFVKMPDREAAAREALDIFSHEVQDRFGLGMSYLNMARVSASQGDEQQTQMYFGKLKELYRETPKSIQVGMFLLGLGADESARGNYAEAKKIFEEGVEVFKSIRSINFQLVLTSEIGHLERRMGRRTQARAIYEEAIQGWQHLGHRGAIAHQLECFGFLAITDEEPKRAAKLFGAAEALRERIELSMTDSEHVEYNQAVAQVRSMLAETEFNALWAEGRSMTMEQAIELALGDS
jgi:tetratricopeptide (TPR) repeat protein